MTKITRIFCDTFIRNLILFTKKGKFARVSFATSLSLYEINSIFITYVREQRGYTCGPKGMWLVKLRKNIFLLLLWLEKITENKFVYFFFFHFIFLLFLLMEVA